MSESLKVVPTIDPEANNRLKTLGLNPDTLGKDVQQTILTLLNKLDKTTDRLTEEQGKLVELEKLVELDFLLPVGNRRALERRLEWAISMRKRYDQPCTLLYFDLNDFKQINDTYGHLAGDGALQHVTTVIKDNIRDSDFLARISGDEFALLMFHTGEKSAKRRGKAIIGNLQSRPFRWEDHSLTISSALGSASVENEDTIESVLHRADQAMYVNKRKSKTLESAE